MISSLQSKAAVRSKAVVLLLLTFCLLLLPLWESVIVLCFVVRYFMSILVLQSSWWGALLNLSSWCLVIVERLFLAVPRSCLQFVIVVFPDHTHLLFLRTHVDIAKLAEKWRILGIKFTRQGFENAF